MKIEFADRTFNVLWPCYVCGKKKTSKDKLNIITIVAGMNIAGSSVQPVMQPNACCDDCFKKLELSETPPPTIHLPQTPINQKDLNRIKERMSL